MKKLLYALLAVLFVLVAAVLLLPSLIDWNAYKDELARQVEQATGRDVTVDGPVSLALLPSPAFSAQQVTLANRAGGADRPMARIAELRVRIALVPLLQAQVEVEQLVLVEPRIQLARDGQGRANWRFPGGGGSAGDAGSADAGTGLDQGLLGQVSLRNVQVVDGTLGYTDASAGIDRQVTGIDARLSAQSLSGPFRVDGSLTAAGIPLQIDGQLGRLGGGGPAPYSLRVQLAGTDAHANLGGALATGAQTRVQGDLQLRGGDLSAALARITGRAIGSYPAQLAQTFSAESKLTLEDGVLKAQNLSLQLGDTGAGGRLRVRFPTAADTDQTRAVADLTVQRLDLDRLLAMQRGDGGTAGDEAAAGGGARGDGAGAFSLPSELYAELNVNVGAILYRDRVIRQGRANAVLDDGTLTLNQAMALLPGASDLALFGTFATRDGQPVFDGRLEAASDNLRGLLAWLRVSSERVAADRLRRMELLADLQAQPGRVTLTNIDLQVDTTQLQGGVAIALRQRPGFGIGLTADKLNLDAYLPAAGAAGTDTQGEGAAPDDGSGDDPSGAGGDGPPLGWLGGFDANFDLRAGQLTYAGTTARDVKLDATLHNQALTVREASIGNLADAAVRLDGKLTELVGLDPQFDLNVDLDVADVPRFAGAFGRADALPAGLGPVGLVGTVQGGLADAKIDGTLSAFGGTTTFQGKIEPLSAPPAFDLVVAAQHDSLQALSQQVPGIAPLPDGNGPLDLTARIAGTTRVFGTDKLKGRLGPVRLSGPASADLTGARPQISAKLETGAIPLAAFAAAGRGGSPTDRPDDGGAGGANGADGSGTRWSAQPLPLSALKAFDLEFELSSEAILLAEGSRLDEAEVAASLSDGVFELTRLTGTLFGGELSARGTLDARETPAASLSIDARQVSSGPLVAKTFGPRALDGPLDWQADLKAEGANPNAMIESLNGEGSVSGRVTMQPQLLLGPRAGELLDRSDRAGELGQQLSQQLGAALGAEVKIGGLTQALDFVGTAFTQERAKLTGSFAVAEGIVTTSDLTLDGLEGRAEVRGRVNLPAWRLDLTTELFRARDAPDTPFVVTRQQGPLGAPNVAITGGAFQQQLAPKKTQEQTGDPETDDAGTGDAGSDEAGTGAAERSGEDEPKRAEDIIRGVLDQLQTDR